ncbi:DUF5709 domain-containing protein [Actinomadura sp. SCN-SB]|uniref:DUF5709 domain-containing protein n=1 Tax=Actinomadura sp. SCN-SB TaxID=3373092 RepID=UPI003750983E
MTERHGTPEDEGIPDLQDGSPEQYWAEDPQEQAVPGDDPAALDDYGMTGTEMHTGEPLDGRLRREQPDGPRMEPGPAAPAGRLVAPDEGAHADTEEYMVGNDVGDDGGGYTAEEAAMRLDEE